MGGGQCEIELELEKGTRVCSPGLVLACLIGICESLVYAEKRLSLVVNDYNPSTGLEVRR